MASVDKKDQLQLLDIQERQVLRDTEDRIIDLLLILDSTSDTISSLIEMYKQFCHDSCDISQYVKDEFDLISFSLRETQLDVIHNRKKAEALHVKVQGTANLVGV